MASRPAEQLDDVLRDMRTAAGQHSKGQEGSFPVVATSCFVKPESGARPKSAMHDYWADYGDRGIPNISSSMSSPT